MDVQCEQGVSRVSIGKGARMGITKSCAVIPMGRHINIDPRNMLGVFPRDDDAAHFSKTELDPMLRDCPCFAGLVRDGEDRGNSRQGSNTIMTKIFAGGSIFLGASISTRLFRGRTASRAYCDEVDAWAIKGAGDEGDQRVLAQGRMGDAPDPLLVEISTPRIMGESLIWESLERSDWRKFFTPCPYCDHGQVLEWTWNDRQKDFGIQWDPGNPEDVWYLCDQCHKKIDYRFQRAMVEDGEYFATNPHGIWPGFHMWVAISPHTQVTWPLIVKKYLETKDIPSEYQVFVNTWLGMPHEEAGDSASKEGLMARAERYPYLVVPDIFAEEGKKEIQAVPRGALMLTAGVDVQESPERIEMQVLGWGLGEEAWVLDYLVLPGDATGPTVWEDLWREILRPRMREDGGVSYIRSTAIDSGYLPDRVHNFVSQHVHYKPNVDHLNYDAYMWAIVGGERKGKRIWPESGTSKRRKERHKTPTYVINESVAKTLAMKRFVNVTEAGPGYTHFHDQLSEYYYQQLMSEHYVREVSKRTGRSSGIWRVKKGQERNEAWDTYIYALSAFYAVRPNLEEMANSAFKIPIPRSIVHDPIVHGEEPAILKQHEGPRPEDDRKESRKRRKRPASWADAQKKSGNPWQKRR